MDIRLDRDSDRTNRRQPVRKSKSKRNGKKILFTVIIVLSLAAVACAVIFLGPKLKDKFTDAFKKETTTAAETTTKVPYTGFVVTDAETGKSENGVFDASLYTVKTVSADDVHKGDLILVNSEHGFSFDKSESDNVLLFGKVSCGLRASDMTINSRLIEPLNDMLSDFYDETRLRTLNIISAYRSFETQETLLNNKIAAVGEEQAKRLIAVPGYTEHHTGLVFDFQVFEDGKSYDFTGTGEYEWITKNCCKYGFIVRYNSDKTSVTGIDNEPWHFRYVGTPHAQIIYKKGMCLEEYLTYLKSFTFGKKHLILEQDDFEYEIYYSSSNKLNVPKDGEYTVSGNNYDGFIVTVKRTVTAEEPSNTEKAND